MTKHPWTEQEEDRLRALRAEGKSSIECATALGRTVASVSARVQRGGFPLGRPAPTPGPTLDTQPPDPVAVERARQEELRTLRERRSLLKEVAGEESLRAAVEKVLREVATRLPPAPPYRPRPSKQTIRASRETMVQVLSDWHNGEVVYAESTRGHNAFNASVFDARVERVLEAHLSIKERLEAGGAWAYDECVVAANGDMVSGTIHELEKHSDHENVVWAVYETGIKLAGFLRALAGVYPKVTVVCTSGNHGRMADARKVQQKEPTRSWDTVVYLFAKTALEGQTNIEFVIPNSYSAAFQVYDWRFLQTHGHDVKSWNSIPFYGINRLVGNINALEAGRGTPIHYWLLSHFHTLSSMPHATGEMFVNGCFPAGTKVSTPCGYSEIQSITAGDMVLGRSGAARVVEAVTSREAEDLVEIGMKGYREPLRATRNHLVWAIKGERGHCVCATHREPDVRHETPRWIPADYLSEGDYVHIPHVLGGDASIPEDDGIQTPGIDLAWAIGLYLAEGHTLLRAGKSKRHHRICLTGHLREFDTHMARAHVAIGQHFHVEGVRSKRPSRTTSQVSFSVTEDTAERWRRWFGHGSGEKRVPAWVLRWTREEINALVAGWVAGDGHTAYLANDRTSHTSATTISPSLAHAMVTLAPEYAFPHHGILERGGPRKNAAHTVHFNHGQDWRVVDGERFVRVCHRRVVPGRVTVYDLQVADEHSFIAQHVGVHNSLIGGTEFTINALGKSDRPQQLMLSVHPEHGVTSRWPLYG